MENGKSWHDIVVTVLGTEEKIREGGGS